MKSAPCLNCQDRKVGCRIDCKRWDEYRAERNQTKAERYKAKQKEVLINEFRKQSIEMTRKGRGRR